MASISKNNFVEKNFHWNFSVNLQDIMFITMGVSLVSRETVMPILVSQLTDSTFAIGLIPAIFSLGYLLPQLLIANFSERLEYKKPFVMLMGGVGERLPYGFMALVIWWLAKPAPTLTLILFFLLLAISATSMGYATPAWFDMIAKVIPVERRGRWAGIGHSLGALMGILGAYFVGKILDAFEFPNNLALLFGLAFGIMAFSWVGLSLTREPPSMSVKARIPLSTYIRQMPAILRANRNYRRFLISRMIILMGTMAIGFFTVFGIEKFNVGVAGLENSNIAQLASLFTGVLIASQAAANLIWGFVGDRKGHKVVLAGAAFAMMLAALIAWLAPSVILFIGTFVLLGTYLAADQVSSLNIILEFCDEADRPTYIGFTNTLLAPLFALAPIIGGWIAASFGFESLFVVACIIVGIGGLLMTLWVKEPRSVPIS